MNKIIFVILLLILTLFLFGCGQQVQDTNVDTVEDNLDVQDLENLDEELGDAELDGVGSDLDLLLNEI